MPAGIRYNVTVKTSQRAGGIVKLRCAAGHVVTCAPSDVRISHAKGVLIGHEVWCDECGTHDSVVDPPQHIALLLEVGAQIAEHSSDRSLSLVGEARRTLSMKYLLDDAAIEALKDAPAPQELIERE